MRNYRCLQNTQFDLQTKWLHKPKERLAYGIKIKIKIKSFIPSVDTSLGKERLTFKKSISIIHSMLGRCMLVLDMLL
jgi:hypothetical protein